MICWRWLGAEPTLVEPLLGPLQLITGTREFKRTVAQKQIIACDAIDELLHAAEAISAKYMFRYMKSLLKAS